MQVRDTGSRALLLREGLDCHGLYDDTLIIFLADNGDLMRCPCHSAFSTCNLHGNALLVLMIFKPPKSSPLAASLSRLGACAVPKP